MATVVMSNELISVVKTNITKYFYNQSIDVPQPKIPLPKLRSEVLSLLYGDNWEVYDKLVSGPINPFVLHTNKIAVLAYPAKHTPSPYILNLLDQCPKPIFIPALEGMVSSFTADTTHCYHPAIVKFNVELRYHNSNNLHIHAERLVLQVNPVGEWTPLIEPIMEYQEIVKAIMEERDATLKAAQNLMQSRRTLGPCLRAWPSLWDFLPQTARDKHMRKTENNSKDDTSNEMTNEEKAVLQQLDVNIAIKRLKGEV